jgi:hypothetical protein
VEPVHEVQPSGMLELMSELERAVKLPTRIKNGVGKTPPDPASGSCYAANRARE